MIYSIKTGMKRISMRSVFLTLVLGLSTLPTLAQCDLKSRKRRASIPGAVLLQRRTSPGLMGNPDPPCDLPHPLNTSVLCPEGWMAFEDTQGRVCLRHGDEPVSHRTAHEKCQSMGGDLVSILSQERQSTVEAFLNMSRMGEHTWIGLTVNRTNNNSVILWPGNITLKNYHNFIVPPDSFHLYRPTPLMCFTIHPNNYRWTPRNCFTRLPFVCDLKPDCPQANRFGDHCEKECHCHGEVGCRPAGGCQYGCQTGWMGPDCCTRKEMAAVAYYCVNSTEQGRYLLLRIDPKNVFYNVFSLVDDAGRQVSWCRGTYKERDASGGYTIKIPVIDNAMIENRVNTDITCPGQKINETYTWRVKLQEKAGLTLPFDRHMRFTCNFRFADTFVRETRHSFSAGELSAEEVIEESRVKVVLEIIDPYTRDVVQQAPLGSTVALRMTLKVEEEEMAQGVHPHSCVAATPNGEVTRPLTDYHGCPLLTSPLSSFRGSNGTVTTDPFPLFAFPGYHDVTFTCSFDLCFTQQSHCNNPCDKHPKRTKRESRKLETHATANANIHVLPVQNDLMPDSGSSMENSHSSAAEMMTPVTWFLLITLVVISAVLIHLLFVRSAKQPLKSIRS